MKINNIIEEFEIGEVITLFLTNGLKEEGKLISIERNSIKMKTLTKTLTIFEEIIGGWAKYELNEIVEHKSVVNDIDDSIIKKEISKLITKATEEIINAPLSHSSERGRAMIFLRKTGREREIKKINEL